MRSGSAFSHTVIPALTLRTSYIKMYATGACTAALMARHLHRSGGGAPNTGESSSFYPKVMALMHEVLLPSLCFSSFAQPSLQTVYNFLPANALSA